MISPRTEDMLGKALLVGAFGWSLMSQSRGLVAQWHAANRPENFELMLLSQVLTLLFVGMAIGLTLRRLPARSVASGWEPRAAAIGGTFLLITLMWTPMGQASTAVLVLANALILGGTILSMWSLHYLGRSFSVMASARELVTGGPYGIVRHPLYLFEAVTMTGVILAHWSWQATLLGAMQFALQFRRMQHEERVLRETFPEYESYASRVPMLIPGRKPTEAAA